MARPRVSLLSRRTIAEAAIEMLDAGRELQVVPLAESLGVGVSSLYHHVSGRTGIIRAMRDVLTQRYAPEVDPSLPWEERVRAAVEALWRMYSDHPRVLQLLLTVVIEEPATMGIYEAMIGALREAGVPEAELLSTVETLDAFAFGAALDSLSPERIFGDAGEDPELAGLLGAHPTGRRRNRILFEHGLGLILGGIRARAA